MISILVTGANGQLGSEIRKIADDIQGMTFHFTDIEELNITNPEAVADFLNTNPVRFIINCAAYTAVDQAEDDPEIAMLLNSTAVGILADESVRREIQLIHISTDYVFNGEGNRPYQVDHALDPQTIYGKTKLAGEKAVRDSGKGIIIRTSWLYSVFGKNFVKTILRLSTERDKLQVVFDQTGSPTNARDLALAILEMIQKDLDGEKKPKYDVYHYSNTGICSWYEFAIAIVAISGSDCLVEAVESINFPTKAIRPRYSVMDKQKLITDYGIKIPHWKESLVSCVEELTS